MRSPEKTDRRKARFTSGSQPGASHKCAPAQQPRFTQRGTPVTTQAGAWGLS